jgi:4-diphosphocytidyl-2-C-methyl-D-erythritol kinase
MVKFAPAKINLGLNVIRKREDGYHEIETVMLPIPLHDVLEVITAPELGRNEIVLTRSGREVPAIMEEDLCVKAVRAVQRRTDIPGIRMHLHKVIPTGAGLGGGSSDAAFTLRALNDLFDLRMEYELPGIAASLGSDVPFFLKDKPQLATGRGEILNDAVVDLRGMRVLVVNPGIHVPTAKVYSGARPTGRSIELMKIISSPVRQWQGKLENVMEVPVFKEHPEIAGVKEKLLGNGALYAAMSGSGSTVFGIFDTTPPHLEWPSAYAQWAFAYN